MLTVNADLHTHSVFAGGTGSGTIQKKLTEMRGRFIETQVISQMKGVNLLGTGDVQFEPYLDFLEENLVEQEEGLFTFEVNENDLSNFLSKKGFSFEVQEDLRYVLQTELIFTTAVGKRRKKAHVVMLFPSFESVRSLNTLLDLWGVSRQKMARPFVVCDSAEQVGDRVNSIMDIDPHVEVIPAHVMTPEGVYGGDLQIDFLDQFFGDSADRIRIVETGLSADPAILGMVPELDNRILISNADAHSSALNRLGREFTSVNLGRFDYRSFIDALRDGNVSKTAEFHPTEGRYFLTGHRDNRKKPFLHGKGQYCYYSYRHLPEDRICPVCKKPLTIGVLQRAYELTEAQGADRRFGEGPKRPYITMIPLIEILGFVRGIKTLSSKKLLREYTGIVSNIGSESRIWMEDNLDLGEIDPEVSGAIVEVKKGNFCFSPPGFDGTYGRLVIGETYDFEDLKVEEI